MELLWISVHSGLRGNETVDGLAKEGIVHQFVGSESAFGDLWAEYREKDKRLDLQPAYGNVRPGVARWLRRCPTSRTVPGSIPGGVTWDFFRGSFRQNHVP